MSYPVTRAYPLFAGKSKSVSSPTTAAPVASKAPAATAAAEAAAAVQVKKKTSAAARKAEINRKGNEKVRVTGDSGHILTNSINTE